MFGPYRTQAVQLVEEGATPQQVDSVLVEWGMAMGPLAVGDLAGTDVSWRIRQEAIKSGSAHVPPRTFEDVLYEKGRYGQKTRKGWYKYDEKRQASPDPDVDRLVREYAAVQGIQRRKISDAEIIERTVGALINEGARLLEEGIALRASDIDIVYIHGYGFPAWRGGPMKWAQIDGLEKTLATIQRYYALLGPAWKPAALLEKAARDGRWG